MSNGYEWKGGAFEPHKWERSSPVREGRIVVSSTATDMAKFMIAHLNDGEYNGQRILQPATAEKMHTRVFGHTCG
jgi:CubicO group peptidase (beta-lactamase class C family)